MKIGCIGTGWVGGAYMRSFESRGFDVIPYSLDPQYVENKEKLKEATYHIIAVPTLVRDVSIVEEACSLLKYGDVAIIKSTLPPGTTKSLQRKFHQLFVFHVPEFLTEVNADFDARHPERNIVGRPIEGDSYDQLAQHLLDEILPGSAYSCIIDSTEAELIKYFGNVYLTSKVVMFNLFYDLAKAYGADWHNIQAAVIQDERIGASHTNPIDKNGRGAGGDCFIKDLEAFHRIFNDTLPTDLQARNLILAMKSKNIELLQESGKDEKLIEMVYPIIKEFA